MCDPGWASQWDGKNAISIFIAFCLNFVIRNENITSEECKKKQKTFEVILHIGELLAFKVGWLKNHVTVKPL